MKGLKLKVGGEVRHLPEAESLNFSNADVN